MKSKLFAYLAVGALLGGATACNDDNVTVVDNAKPNTVLAADHIQTEAGYAINFKGTITDADGISTIKIWCEDLFLKKVIDIADIYADEGPVTEYELDYKFTLAKLNPGDEYDVVITVTDLAGNQDEQHVKVTLDGDYTAPFFAEAPGAETSVLADPDGGETLFELAFRVTDNIGVDYVIVDVVSYDLSTKEEGESIENFPMTLDAYGEKAYEYSEGIIMPEGDGVYKIKIEAWDMPAQFGEVRSSKVEGLLTVLGGVDFAKMYLADVATAAELTSDVFGVPMRVDRVGECQYRARYYTAKANTEIFFIPQKAGFSPICYGLDPTDSSHLINSPGNVLPLVLPQAGVYYEINFNTDSGEYEFHTYEVADYMNPIFYEYGAEVFNVWGAYAPGSGDEYLPADDAWLQPFLIGTGNKPNNIDGVFIQDPTNKNVYMWEQPKDFAAGEELNWMIHEVHPAEWWNAIAWRVDDSVECDIFYYYGGVVKQAYLDWAYGEGVNWASWSAEEGYRGKWVPDNWIKPTVKTAGTYQFYFDAHLGRGKMVPAK